MFSVKCIISSDENLLIGVLYVLRTSNNPNI
jgi:hypothetical protein